MTPTARAAIERMRVDETVVYACGLATSGGG